MARPHTGRGPTWASTPSSRWARCLQASSRWRTGCPDRRRTRCSAPARSMLRSSGRTGVLQLPVACRLSVERRTLPGEDIETSRRRCRGLLDSIAARRPVVPGVSQQKDAGQRCARSAGRCAHRAGAGRTGPARDRQACQSSPAWPDGWTRRCWQRQASRRSSSDPAGEGLHADVEWVDLGSVEQCHEVVLATVREFCE